MTSDRYKYTREKLKEKLKNLHLTDDVFFTVLMQDEEFCKKVLSVIMEKEFLHIEYFHVQETIQNTPGYKSIRLDVYAKDVDGTSYVIEVQKSRANQHIPKRSRYYQGLVDVSELLAGKEVNYGDLPTQYIVFITDEDLFGKGLYRYQFTNKCNEDAKLDLSDETYKIFLNTNGSVSTGVDETLIQFLKYVKDSTEDTVQGNTKLQEIHSIVKRLKSSKKMEDNYMNIHAFAYEAREEGIQEGIQKGQREVVSNLTKKGMSIEEIAEIVNVTVSEVLQLQENRIGEIDSSKH